MTEVLTEIRDLVWGVPLIVLLLLTGLNLTVLLGAVQFRRFGSSLVFAFIRRSEAGGEGDVSHFRALTTALSATVGVANIVGVATAIGLGGPGALFWMWVAGILGMATKFSEAVLGVRFRETDANGEKAGGPMYYLRHGLGDGQLGRVLAGAFAVCAAAAAFGIGNGVQSHSVADVARGAFGTPTWLAGIIVASAVGAVILGGIRSIGRITGLLVPLMLVLYVGCTVVILVGTADRIPDAFRLVLAGAFGGEAVAGGALGFTMLQALRHGLPRGVYSGEAGLGTGGIAAAAAATKEPVRQALVSMTQVFIDTLVICTLTGLVLLTTGAWRTGLEGADMARAAFDAALPAGGGALLAVVIGLFAISTMIGWAYYGERCLVYLAGERAIRPYRLAFIAVAAGSSVVGLDVVWLVSDILNGLMAAPNLLGLLLLAGLVRREARRYFAKERSAAPDQPRKGG